MRTHHDWATHGHRFGDGGPETLVRRWEHKDIRSLKKRTLLGTGDDSDEGNATG